MTEYIFKRLLLIIPTLFGIILLNFLIVQIAPGGPVEQTIAKITNLSPNSSRVAGSLNDGMHMQNNSYLGSEGVDKETIEEIKKLYGFDKPASERFFKMIKDFIFFDFGNSFYQDKPVIEIIKEKLPVSISLGLWTTILIYSISIPLGIKKALTHGSRFDITTTTIIIIGYAIPSFLFAILLIILFAGGNYFNIFPLRGLYSDNFDQLSFFEQILDYLWHITLPVISMVISGFASMTLLTKNSFLEEINKQYVITARAKGLTENQTLYKHVFRNAMLIIISGFPAAFVSIFFTGSLLIEVIFSLDGLGLLGFESMLNRDYPVVFATLYIYTLIGLVLNLIGDLTYVLIDPRIDFSKRD